MKAINYPKVVLNKEHKVYVSFYIDKRRYRLYNGSRLEIDLNPNDFPEIERLNQGHILASAIYQKLIAGDMPNEIERHVNINTATQSDKVYIEMALQRKLQQSHSSKHKKSLRFAYRKMLRAFEKERLTAEGIQGILDQYTNNTSYNTLRRYMLNLCNAALELGMPSNPMKGIKTRKAKANLNKPFSDVGTMLKEIEQFNHNLFLCCLLTYGCLLRPHREVRELKWEDFSDDLSIIKLSGHRNKSGRNRIVPVPHYVKEELKRGEPQHNIFTSRNTAPNPDYFKTLWGRFKKVSQLLDKEQTLYSFRHSGAVEIFKRTGSIEKLRSAMGHSSILVSLTYLRGLEVAELKEIDMPIL